MARAKKQPSGMWRVRVYSHSTPDGKKHYKSFTGPTKQEAEQAAAKFTGRIDRSERVDLTVAEAIAGFIKAKEGVLSPSTIRGYRTLERNNYAMISMVKIRKLTTERVQTWISDQAATLSAKTVKNAYGLLVSSVRLYAPETMWRITLPTIITERRVSVPDASVSVLYNAADGWMKIAIGLAAFGSLRAGEICSLTFRDILPGGLVYVHSDMVRTPNGGWTIKEFPKTKKSVRVVDTIPADVLELIGDGDPDDRCVGHTPSRLGDNFRNLCKRHGITGVRFHDLRGYFASSGAEFPDTFLAPRGGWDPASRVMKENYQKEKEKESKKYADKMRRKFEKVIQKV